MDHDGLGGGLVGGGVAEVPGMVGASKGLKVSGLFGHEASGGWQGIERGDANCDGAGWRDNGGDGSRAGLTCHCNESSVPRQGSPGVWVQGCGSGF